LNPSGRIFSIRDLRVEWLPLKLIEDFIEIIIINLYHIPPKKFFISSEEFLCPFKGMIITKAIKKSLAVALRHRQPKTHYRRMAEKTKISKKHAEGFSSFSHPAPGAAPGLLTSVFLWRYQFLQ